KLNELTKILDRHVGRYEGLAELLNQEQAALIEIDLDRLQEVAKAKETVVLEIKRSLPGLTKCIKEAAAALNLPAEPLPTLADLSKASPQPWFTSLNQTGAALARLKRNTARHNEANHSFVQEALELVTSSIAILTGAAAVHQENYRPDGQQAPASTFGPTKLSREV
ncbi:MAG: flagellar protein FlgN, partial [Thermodesulfobacteriota bacterium]|nr:flagellar protein FlgN [Thermodesulfobacteriota bacterium]